MYQGQALRNQRIQVRLADMRDEPETEAEELEETARIEEDVAQAAADSWEASCDW